MSNISFDYLADEQEPLSTNNFKMPNDDMHDLLKQIFGDIDENQKNYQKCLELVNNGLHLVPANIELMVHKIKYLVLMNQLDEAEDVDEQINKQHGKILNVFDAFFNYYECNFDKCDFERIGNNLNINMVEEMMIKTMEFKRSLIFANSEINAKNYSEAVSILHDLDNCDDTNHKAYLTICKMLLDCYTKMSNQDDNIIKYASEILKENPLDVNMLIIRADSFKKIKNYKFAENDLKAILKFESLSNDDQMRVQDLLKIVVELQENQESYKNHHQKENPTNDYKSTEKSLKKSEEFNDRGNVQFKSDQYENAIHYYSDAIKLCPEVVKYYTNRSCCYVLLKNFDKAILDALKAIDIEPSFWRGYSHAINSFINLGNIDQAKIYIKKMQNNVTEEEINKFNGISKVQRLETLHEEILKFWDEKKFEECLKRLEDALKIATACKKYGFLKTECLIELKEYEKADESIVKDQKDSYSIYLTGLIAFHRKEYKKSVVHFREALILDPDLTKAIAYKNKAEDYLKAHNNQEDTNKQNNNKRSEDLNDLGKNQFKSNQYKNAIHCYSEAIKLCPQVAKYYSNRSCCYLFLRNFDKAIVDAKKVIDIEPSFSKGYFHAINAFINLGNIDQAQIYIKEMQANVTDEAIKKFDGIPKVQKLEKLHEDILKFWDGENFEECLKHLEDALEIATACKQYVFWLTECLIKTERYEKAEKLILQHRKEPYGIFLDGLVAFYRKNYDLSIDRFQEALNLNPDLQKALKFKNLAEELRTIQSDQENAKKEEAKKKQETFNNSTKKSEELNQRGNIQFKSNQYANAIHYYSDAIQLCPQVVKYYTNRCSSYMAMSNFECALNDAMKAIEIDPSFWKGYSHAINSFINLGNIDQAQIYIKKMQNNVTDEAIKKFDGISKVQKLATLHEEILKFWDEKKFEECLKRLEDALKIATACKKYGFLKTECLIELEEYEKADETIVKDQKDSYSIYLAGLIAFHRKEYKKSVVHFREALILDPDLTKAIEFKNKAEDYLKAHNDQEDISTKKAEEFNDRGNVQFKSDQYENAIHYYSDAIKLCPDVVKYYTNRSYCYLLIRNFDKSILDALKAIEIDPSFWRGYSHAINAFINLGNIDQAQIYITKMQNNVTDEAIKKFDGIYKVKKLATLHEEILKFWDEKKFEECLKHLEDALKIATACKKYWFLKTECLIELGEYEKADQSIVKDQKDSYSIYLTGLIAFQRKKYKKSVVLFRKALILDPDLTKAIEYKNKAEDHLKTQKDKDEVNKKKEKDKQDKFTQNCQDLIVHGNAHLKSKEYENAIKCYSEAIQLKPNVAKYYINRSSCFLVMQNYKSAIQDALEALKIDKFNYKGYSCAFEGSIALGNIKEAQKYVKNIKELGIKKSNFSGFSKLKELEDHNSKIEKLRKQKNYDECLNHLNAACKIAVSYKKYDLWMAECLVMTERELEAKQILCKYPADAFSFYLEGLIDFFNNKLEKSIINFDKAIKFKCDSEDATKYMQAAINLQKYEMIVDEKDGKEASDACQSIITHKRVNTLLKLKAYVIQADLHFRTNNEEKMTKAFENCNKALRLKNSGDENCIKALLIRAQIHCNNKEFEDAIFDYDEVLKLDCSRKDEINTFIQNAKMQIKPPYPQLILNVKTDATKEEIEKAFKKKLKSYHSDKHPDATDVEKKKLDLKVHKIYEARKIMLS